MALRVKLEFKYSITLR